MVLIKRPVGSPDVWNCALTPACPSQGRLRREAEGTREPLKDPWAAEAEEAERSPRTAAGPLGLGAPFPGPAAEAGREGGAAAGPAPGAPGREPRCRLTRASGLHRAFPRSAARSS